MQGLRIAAAAAVVAVPLLVQAQQGGVTADGWQARLDRGADVAGSLGFTADGTGVHAQTGPRGAAIFWQPDSTATGAYTISASFTQVEPSNHPNAYGLFFGGADLAGDDQRYAYFVIRQGGEYLIKARIGADTPTIVDWTANDAINDLDAAGRATNTLAVEVGDDAVRFLINDVEVSSQPRAAVETDGITGLRINHFLNVQVDDLNLGM